MEESKGRMLIRRCIDQLNEKLETDKCGNRALYPVLIIFFGSQSVEQFSTIRDILKVNWQNAEFLKYINLVKKPQEFICRDLVTGKTSGFADPSDFIEDAVVEMLGTDEYIFENKTRIRVECVLPGEDENGEAYYDFMINMKLGSRYNIIKTTFLMMDETGENKRRRIGELLRHIRDKREEAKSRLGTIYLLSNCLKDGNILQGYRLTLNYRLAADLMLLGGNRGTDKNNNSVSSIEGYNIVKTAAYALVEKPVRSIAIISLQKVMGYLQEENEHSYKQSADDMMKSVERIQSKLGIERGRIQCLETVFREEIVAKILPRPSELEYLAYASKKDFRDIHKEKRVNSQRLNQATRGNWNLFFEENYKKRLENLLSDPRFISGCMEEIEKKWYLALDYRDALYGLEDGRVKTDLEEFRITAAAMTGNSLEENVHYWAVEEMRKLFYSHMTGELSKLLAKLHQEAKEFERSYKGLEREISRELIDDDETNIRSYYENLAESYLRKKGRQAGGAIFQLKNGADEIIRSLENTFKELILSNPIYGMSFEKELQTRLNTMAEIDQVLQIKKVLEEKIENKVRLHGKNTCYENNLRGIYYLMNKDAEYAKELNSDVVRRFSVFHLKRTDCIEKIAVYDLDGKDGYCDLTEMAGEVR